MLQLVISARMWELSAAELAAFPLGVVRLDRNGVIEFFNPAEETFVHRRAADAIGRNYFRDVAPCAAVKEFEGRFREFVALPDARSETFGFFYPFGWGHKEVRITMLKRAGGGLIMIVTEIADVSDEPAE